CRQRRVNVQKVRIDAQDASCIITAFLLAFCIELVFLDPEGREERVESAKWVEEVTVVGTVMLVAAIICGQIAEQGAQAAQGLLKTGCRVDFIPVCYDEKYHMCGNLGRARLNDFAHGQFND